ncbi:hypothetical protein [Methylobacterium tarhaniae]|uniref:hypothetical protein n=1 Tax=Methylobacterium tarhaniae TaxID=1187852 RepID=UPI003D03E38E
MFAASAPEEALSGPVLEALRTLSIAFQRNAGAEHRFDEAVTMRNEMTRKAREAQPRETRWAATIRSPSLLVTRSS